MSYKPTLYDHINLYNASFSPSTVHAKNTGLADFFRRYLLQKAISVFKWNLPKTWAKNYFQYILYIYGYVGIVNTSRFGIIPQEGVLSGYDVFYQPTHITVTNPLIPSILRQRIGEQCGLIKLQPDYGGIMDIVGYYADMMAISAEAAGVNLFNSKLAYVFPARDKNSAESYKKMFDRVSSGEPAVVIDKSLFDDTGKQTWSPFSQNLKETYITDQILSDLRKIEAMFDTDIGIPSANTDKRERLITDEVNANNVETASKCELWLETIREGIEETKQIFPDVDISVDWRVQPDQVTDTWDQEGERKNDRNDDVR